eukprot:SAG31_NODE_44026_length_264_cov_1.193939_1_plen_52_part_10
MLLDRAQIPHFIPFILKMTGISKEEFDRPVAGDATKECWKDSTSLGLHTLSD